MILLAPLPPAPAKHPIATVGDLTICAAGNWVRVDVHGEVHGNRIVVFLTPAQARLFATELSRCAR